MVPERDDTTVPSIAARCLHPSAEFELNRDLSLARQAANPVRRITKGHFIQIGTRAGYSSNANRVDTEI